MESSKSPQRKFAPCGARSKSTGQPCKKPGVGAGGRCKFHGGMSTGAPGNQNARKHGLFSAAFKEGSAGAETYARLEHMDATGKAREAADMLISYINESMAVDPELESAKGAMAELFRQAVANGEMTRDYAQKALAKLYRPDPVSVAKALAPLRGLLARLDAADAEAARNAPTGLIVVEAKSADWAQTQAPPALPPGE
jgi:hypothetical protein